MFADFGTELPALTRAVIRVSDEFRGYWWGFKLVITVLVVIRSVRRRWSMPSHQTLRWTSAGLILALLLILVGMALPIFMLGQVAASLQ